MATDPAMRGRVMSLYMMVFVGGTPVGAPIVGWVTDTYGARVGPGLRRRRRDGRRPDGRRWSWPGVGTACGCVPGLELRPPARPLRQAGAGRRSRSRSRRRRGSGGSRWLRGVSTVSAMSAASAMNTVRLFAAVLPPEDVTVQLAVAVAGLRSLPGADGLRWTGVPGWHFTLAFYGEVAEDVVPELSERLARAAHRTDAFALSVRGGGQFGHGRALWAGAAGEVGVLRLLADRAEAAGRKAGVEMGEHRRYQPHLTVARSREALRRRRTSRPWTSSRAACGRWTTWPSSAAISRSRGCRGSSPGTRWSPIGPSRRPVRLHGVDPKTRNRIMAGALVLMFVVVALAAAVGK